MVKKEVRIGPRRVRASSSGQKHEKPLLSKFIKKRFEGGEGSTQRAKHRIIPGFQSLFFITLPCLSVVIKIHSVLLYVHSFIFVDFSLCVFVKLKITTFITAVTQFTILYFLIIIDPLIKVTTHAPVAV